MLLIPDCGRQMPALGLKPSILMFANPEPSCVPDFDGNYSPLAARLKDAALFGGCSDPNILLLGDPPAGRSALDGACAAAV